MTIYDFSVNHINGKPCSLAQYQGKVVLIVNTASQCGFTPQYKALEQLYQQYHAAGFEILGFPCNQFGSQEPASAEEISIFCEKNYGITFPLFEKIEVNGKYAAPLYHYLKKAAPGFLFTTRIKWNFTKFLIDRKGHAIARFAPQTKPEALVKQITKLLAIP